MNSIDRRLSETSRLAADQRRRWLSGDRRAVEAYLQESPALSASPEALQDLIYHEFRLREELGERPDGDEYCRRFPQLQHELRKLFEVHEAFRTSMKPGTMRAVTDPHIDPAPASRTSTHAKAHESIDTPRPSNEETLRHRIGRYDIRRKIGQGGFGHVFLAYDSELDREVAIKSPRRDRFRSDDDVAQFVIEARAAARLNHPAVVAIYDVGRAADGACYVVMQYVAGRSLLEAMGAPQLGPRDVAELVATVALGLHHAHERGLVHRDLKPGNILLDAAGCAHVADFGLALNEKQRRERAGEIAGTPAYMSPEQVRGETHRLDGRTDLWSLGVVMYELLTGRRPFGEDPRRIYDEILHHEPTSLREIAPETPLELERICHRCLSKRVSGRYASGLELAQELRSWIDSGAAPQIAAPATSDPHNRGFIPKGLLAFTAEDADQFLEMLPGPRDHRGWPDSLRFWTQRIECYEDENCFSVGVLYGPTGSGKSSFVAAGLLPRLKESVLTVASDCDPEDTERRLVERLRVACPALREGLSLPEAVRALREDAALPPGKKVLIVLDQFEQWLQCARPNDQALIDAMRHCDGKQVQCLLLVRDDFWMPLTRFMAQLDLRLVEGVNCAALDLIPAAHARRLLRGFGVALERLPAAHRRPLNTAEERFLDQAIDELSEEGAVSPARLALFVEMMRHRPWEPATLRSLGGAQGIAAKFLDEALSAPTATPRRRRHAAAAAAVLATLLPEAATGLKGRPQTHTTLLESSGYREQPSEFEELMSLLRQELRLVTLSASEGATKGAHAAEDEPRYRLSHDFLVPPLRDWLSRRQRETAAGRAALRLEELSQIWNAKPERRRLPSVWEWAAIVRHVPRRHRNARQSQFMHAANRLHLSHIAATLAVAALLFWGVHELSTRINLRTQVERLLAAETAGAPAIIEELAQFGGRGQQSLRDQLNSSLLSETQERNVRLALLTSDTAAQSAALNWLDEEEPQDAGAVAEVLLTANPSKLREVVERAIVGDESQFVAYMPVLQRRRDASVRELMAIVNTPEGVNNEQRNAQWFTKQNQHRRRQALACSALAQLGQMRFAEAILESDAQSTARSYFINLSAPLRTPPQHFIQRLEDESGALGRRALLLLLGSYDSAQIQESLSAQEYRELVAVVNGCATTDPDAGVHGTANWALRRWQEPPGRVTPPSSYSVNQQPEEPSWTVSHSGVELALIPAGLIYYVGPGPDLDADDQDYAVGKLTLDHSFAIATHETTRRQFGEFRKLEPERLTGEQAQLPIANVDWHDAAEYCNWLSEREGVPRGEWCYRRIDARDDTTPAVPGIETDRTYWMVEEPDALERTGYRLPSELEWECACRAGTAEIRFYGFADDLLRYYSWYAETSPVAGKAQPHAVGLLKPNEWGLFDTYGNVLEWCHEMREEVDEPNQEVADVRTTQEEVVAKPRPGLKPVYGGAYGDFPNTLRSDNGEWVPAEQKNVTNGFRVARTIRTKPSPETDP